MNNNRLLPLLALLAVVALSTATVVIPKPENLCNVCADRGVCSIQVRVIHPLAPYVECDPSTGSARGRVKTKALGRAASFARPRFIDINGDGIDDSECLQNDNISVRNGAFPLGIPCARDQENDVCQFRHCDMNGTCTVPTELVACAKLSLQQAFPDVLILVIILLFAVFVCGVIGIFWIKYRL